MLTSEEQDKKLVKQYKKTNKLLRKQLEALNEQIDQLILQKSNRIGLQKLPKVQKQITDVKVIHFQVENLKKRLQHIKHDNEQYKQKIVVDWIQKYKQLEKSFDQKVHQKQQIQRKVKVYEKRLKQEKSSVNLKKEQDKLLQKIEIANQELARLKKIQKDLRSSVQLQNIEENKKKDILHKLQIQQKQLLQKSKILTSKEVIKEKNTNKGQISDYQWQKLKQDFLQLKESKQQQQMFLYEQNARLRNEIKFLTQQVKTKKNRVEVVRKYNTLQTQKKLSSRLERLNQRNTIDVNNRSESRKKRGFSNFDSQRHQSVRYRDRNNSISYN